MEDPVSGLVVRLIVGFKMIELVVEPVLVLLVVHAAVALQAS